MTLVELSAQVGVTVANLSILKNGHARALRFSTLTAICDALGCTPATCSDSTTSPRHIQRCDRWTRILAGVGSRPVGPVQDRDDRVAQLVGGRGEDLGRLAVGVVHVVGRPRLRRVERLAARPPPPPARATARPASRSAGGSVCTWPASRASSRSVKVRRSALGSSSTTCARWSAVAVSTRSAHCTCGSRSHVAGKSSSGMPRRGQPSDGGRVHRSAGMTAVRAGAVHQDVGDRSDPGGELGPHEALGHRRAADVAGADVQDAAGHRRRRAAAPSVTRRPRGRGRPSRSSSRLERARAQQRRAPGRSGRRSTTARRRRVRAAVEVARRPSRRAARSPRRRSWPAAGPLRFALEHGHRADRRAAARGRPGAAASGRRRCRRCRRGPRPATAACAARRGSARRARTPRRASRPDVGQRRRRGRRGCAATPTSTGTGMSRPRPFAREQRGDAASGERVGSDAVDGVGRQHDELAAAQRPSAACASPRARSSGSEQSKRRLIGRSSRVLVRRPRAVAVAGRGRRGRGGRRRRPSLPLLGRAAPAPPRPGRRRARRRAARRAAAAARAGATTDADHVEPVRPPPHSASAGSCSSDLGVADHRVRPGCTAGWTRRRRRCRRGRGSASAASPSAQVDAGAGEVARGARRARRRLSSTACTRAAGPRRRRRSAIAPEPVQRSTTTGRAARAATTSRASSIAPAGHQLGLRPRHEDAGPDRELDVPERAPTPSRCCSGTRARAGADERRRGRASCAVVEGVER